jgi:phosphoribosylformimino-5-aminoimidazole carboxamide ribonucleotide (ProFAR) isomerase
MLGFGVKEVFISFCEHISEKYGAEPGFITLNLPKLVDFLLDCGIENPIVCSAINKAGYFMNPGIETYEKTLSEKKFRPLAMSILASGAVKPKEAIEYVCRLKAIQSIIFGASSKEHITETKELIEKYS